jgi:hypothetical protein
VQFRALYGTEDFLPAFIFISGGLALVLFYFIAARKANA